MLQQISHKLTQVQHQLNEQCVSVDAAHTRRATSQKVKEFVTEIVHLKSLSAIESAELMRVAKVHELHICASDYL